MLYPATASSRWAPPGKYHRNMCVDDDEQMPTARSSTVVSSRGSRGARVEGVELGDGAQVPVGRQATEAPLEADRALDVAQRVAAERHERARRGHVARGRAPWRTRRRRDAARRRGGRRRRAGARPTQRGVVDLAVRRARHGTGVDDDRRRPAGPVSAATAADVAGGGAGRAHDEPVVVAGRRPRRARWRRARLDGVEVDAQPNGLTKRARRPTISNTSSSASWRPRSPVASSSSVAPRARSACSVA